MYWNQLSEKLFLIKIVKSTSPTSWYANRIGDKYKVYEHKDGEHYILKTSSVQIFNKEDVILIREIT